MLSHFSKSQASIGILCHNLRKCSKYNCLGKIQGVTKSNGPDENQHLNKLVATETEDEMEYLHRKKYTIFNTISTCCSSKIKLQSNHTEWECNNHQCQVREEHQSLIYKRKTVVHTHFEGSNENTRDEIDIKVSTKDQF